MPRKRSTPNARVAVARNAIAGWWWCDPSAALMMVPIIAKEGIEGIRGEAHCDDCGDSSSAGGPVSSREHWDTIYRTKTPNEVSWYQPEAALSLDLIRRTTPALDAPILDVGGGASTLVDGLLEAGYRKVDRARLTTNAPSTSSTMQQ